MDLSLVELWYATGPLARTVVLLLAAMSVATGALAAEKWLRLRRAERATAAFLAAWPSTPPAALPELIARHGESPAARLVETVSRALAAAPAGAARDIHDHAVRRHLLATATDLRRGLSLLATVGSTAPFIGLFGTVVGIINAFHAMGTSGRGGVQTVSTGIAEALVTTAFGIMVAIPAVWLFNHLTQRIARLLSAAECTGEDLAVARLSGWREVAAAPRGRAAADA
jgi:biopolymer transport protein ExbB/TolQ